MKTFLKGMAMGLVLGGTLVWFALARLEHVHAAAPQGNPQGNLQLRIQAFWVQNQVELYKQARDSGIGELSPSDRIVGFSCTVDPTGRRSEGLCYVAIENRTLR